MQDVAKTEVIEAEAEAEFIVEVILEVIATIVVDTETRIEEDIVAEDVGIITTIRIAQMMQIHAMHVESRDVTRGTAVSIIGKKINSRTHRRAASAIAAPIKFRAM